MPIESTTIFVLLIILALGLVIPAITKRFRFPFVTSLILLGAILGPHGVQYIQSNDIIDFFGFLGFTFLMFMAGLETRPSELKQSAGKITVLSLLNGVIPFVTGVAIARFFDFNWTTAFLVGTIFISSSIAIALPVIKSVGLFKRAAGKQMVASVLILDSVSLIFLAVIFQSVNPVAFFPLPVHFAILAILLVGLRLFVPQIGAFFLRKTLSEHTEREDQVRFMLVTLFVVLVVFELLGVHPILAAFIVGLLLSDLVTSERIFEKLHVLSYGLFIPVFFFVVGMDMDLSILTSFNVENAVLVAIVIGVIVSKFVSGFLGGVLTKMHWRDAMIFGSITTIQLTTSLAATYAAARLGLLSDVLVTSILTLSVLTTIGAPIFARYLAETVPLKK